MSIIKVKNVSVIIEGNLILDDISFSLNKGDYVGLIGPNGAGKTTLIKTILGKIKYSQGSIHIKSGTKIGYVPQNYKLSQVVPISVREVLLMGKNAESKYSEEDVLKLVGLEKEFLQKNFHDLSGGQAQRVIIARSLFGNPDVLFFDEPLTGVDFETKLKLHELLSHLNKTQGLTILFVSHEVEHIIHACHKILCLHKKLHEGCHPIDFIKGKIKCPVIETTFKMCPVHHHHKTQS